MKDVLEVLEELKVKNNGNQLTKKEFEEMKIEDFNNQEGTMHITDGIECDKCRNKGYVYFIRYESLYDDYITSSKECGCMKQRKLARKAINSGLGDYLKKRSNDYIATEDWQKENKHKMIEFCKNNAEDDTWFISVGQSGSGKTLLTSIIANHLLYNIHRNVIYITWTDFISKLKRDVMGDNQNEVSEYLNEIKNIEVLFIDELLKKYTEADLKYIIEIINYRYSNNLKTLITSERNIDELLDIDEATFSRVLEKCGKFVIDIKKDRSKNYRIKNVKF